MVIRKGCFHGYTSRRATSRAEGARPLNNQLNGRTVLDTGASSGLGVDFAREFAARREERLFMMDSDRIAGVAIRAMLRSRAEIVPGWSNALTAFSTRFTPRPLAAAMTNRLMGGT